VLFGLVFSTRESRRERRWREGFVRGHVTLGDLRPGRNHDQGQELECQARFWLPGVPEITGRYRTDDVGPLDWQRSTAHRRPAARCSPWTAASAS
jgi:hypothetical protein